MANLINTLNALEKAYRKIEKAIDNYNSNATNPLRTVEIDRKYFAKSSSILKRISNEYDSINSKLWDNGVFY